MTIENSLTESERAEIMSELGTLADTVKRSYAEDDVELYLSTLDEDAIVSMPGLPPARGHTALRELFVNRPPLPSGATFSVDVSEIEPLSANWAYAYGTDTLTLPDGAEEKLTFLVLIGKTREGWKTYREVLSPDRSPT